MEAFFAGRVRTETRNEKRQNDVFVVFEKVVGWLAFSAVKFLHHGV
jgi:hypothetical protein